MTSVAGRSHQGEDRHKLTISANALTRRAFCTQSKARPAETVAEKWLGISGNQAAGRPTIGEFPRAVQSGQGARNIQEKWHSYANPARACRGPDLGLGHRHRHSPDVARARALEWLSAAPVGHGRLSGTLVRGLSRSQPIHRLRP